LIHFYKRFYPTIRMKDITNTMSAYEQIRQENIKEREYLFQQLEIDQAKKDLKKTKKPPKKPKTASVETGITRRSLRVPSVKFKYVEGIKARREIPADSEGRLISNDIADYVLTKCELCGKHMPLTRLRFHTASAHGVQITEYKRRFGLEPPLLKEVFHRCGVCENLVLMDHDAIAGHLKIAGHPRITNKNYKSQYMVDSRKLRKKVKGRV